MTLSPDDLAAMGREHVATLDEQSMSEFCHHDGLSWPCDSRRLLDEVEARHREIAGLKALFIREDVPRGCRSVGTYLAGIVIGLGIALALGMLR